MRGEGGCEIGEMWPGKKVGRDGEAQRRRKQGSGGESPWMKGNLDKLECDTGRRGGLGIGRQLASR